MPKLDDLKYGDMFLVNHTLLVKIGMGNAANTVPQFVIVNSAVDCFVWDKLGTGISHLNGIIATDKNITVLANLHDIRKTLIEVVYGT